jgi:2-octaprenyl-6-methoxyphenol hydroxylase
MISGIAPSGLLKSVKFKGKDNSKYNLIIICTGSNSRLTKTLFNDQSYERSYGEVSITTILRHSFIKNNVAKQIFLNNGILALLPISNTTTSVVWSVKKNIVDKYKGNKDSFLKNKIKFYIKDFIKKAEFISNIEFKDLNFFIRKKYFQDRVLLFGDALHQVHPLAGQGFNMVLRDLASLEKTLKNKIGLGLDIGSSDILSEFSNEIKPGNFVYSLGIDFIKNCFSFDKKVFRYFRNKIITELNKNNFAKDQFINFADRGLKL